MKSVFYYRCNRNSKVGSLQPESRQHLLRLCPQNFAHCHDQIRTLLTEASLSNGLLTISVSQKPLSTWSEHRHPFSFVYALPSGEEPKLALSGHRPVFFRVEYRFLKWSIRHQHTSGQAAGHTIKFQVFIARALAQFRPYKTEDSAKPCTHRFRVWISNSTNERHITRRHNKFEIWIHIQFFSK